MKSKEYLIRTLLDKTVDVGARDDCAMDLADYHDSDVLEALSLCAQDLSDDEIIHTSCGESLAEIMVKRYSMDKNILIRFHQ